MSGSCDTGMLSMAIAPAKTVTIAMTIAILGRSMNVAEIIGSSPGARGCIRARPREVRGSGCHLRARPDPLDAFQHDALARLQAVGDHDPPGIGLAEFHAAPLRATVGADYID